MTSAVDPLDRLIDVWRRDPAGGSRFVPRFDPWSGGTGSRVLALMQSPGPATIAAGAAAICSEDNPGPTVASFARARRESGLARAAYLRWNIVPWALTNAVSSADIEEGRLALGELLRVLPALRAIVTFGTPALTGVMRHLTLATDARPVAVLAAPHPSPANGRHRAEQHQRAVQALRLAALA